MKETDKIEKIKNYLEGSCLTIDEVMHQLFEENEDDLTEDEKESINTDIFRCSSCGWWSDYGEESGIDEGELICNNCAEDEE